MWFLVLNWTSRRSSAREKIIFHCPYSSYHIISGRHIVFFFCRNVNKVDAFVLWIKQAICDHRGNKLCCVGKVWCCCLQDSHKSYIFMVIFKNSLKINLCNITLCKCMQIELQTTLAKHCPNSFFIYIYILCLWKNYKKCIYLFIYRVRA